MNNLEGSEVMEKLAAIGLVDDFLEAVDADDVKMIVNLLREANVDEASIRSVLQELG